jgi:hypothetical protein
MQKARLLCALAALGLVLAGCQQGFLPGSASGARSLGQGSAGGEAGFDEFGYNYNARIFVGAADGVDKMLDGTVWAIRSTPTTTWSWRGPRPGQALHRRGLDAGCLEDNEWNGMGPDRSRRSGTTRSSGWAWNEERPYWREGLRHLGPVQVIFSHGTAAAAFLETHACLPVRTNQPGT